jgi:hypothetical protein
MIWNMTSELAGQRQASLHADADRVRQGRLARLRRPKVHPTATAGATRRHATPSRRAARLAPGTASCN